MDHCKISKLIVQYVQKGLRKNPKFHVDYTLIFYVSYIRHDDDFDLCISEFISEWGLYTNDGIFYKHLILTEINQNRSIWFSH